MRINSLSRVNL